MVCPSHVNINLKLNMNMNMNMKTNMKNLNLHLTMTMIMNTNMDMDTNHEPTRTVPTSLSKHVVMALALWFSITKEVVTAIHKGGSKSSARKGDRENTAHNVSATDTLPSDSARRFA